MTEIIIIAVLIIILVYQDIIHILEKNRIRKEFHEERQKLLDRIMSVDYEKYSNKMIEKENMQMSLKLELERIKQDGPGNGQLDLEDAIKAAQKQGRIQEI
jgi:hypothetical protein